LLRSTHVSEHQGGAADFAHPSSNTGSFGQRDADLLEEETDASLGALITYRAHPSWVHGRALLPLLPPTITQSGSTPLLAFSVSGPNAGS